MSFITHYHCTLEACYFYYHSMSELTFVSSCTLSPTLPLPPSLPPSLPTHLIQNGRYSQNCSYTLQMIVHVDTLQMIVHVAVPLINYAVNLSIWCGLVAHVFHQSENHTGGIRSRSRSGNSQITCSPCMLQHTWPSVPWTSDSWGCGTGHAIAGVILCSP